MKNLTKREIDKEIRAANKKLRLRVSNYLYLNIKPPISAGHTVRASWSFGFKLNGKTRYMGLGPYPDVDLVEASEARDKARKLVRAGIDPIDARHAARIPAKRKPTFGEIAEALVRQREPGWKHKHSAIQWRQTLRDHCADLLDRSVDEVDTEAVMNALKLVQQKIGGTIVRNRARRIIEAVLDAAKVQGHRSGDNPAAWRGNLAHLLPKPKAGGHYAAMPYADVPALVKRLRTDTALASTVLEFVILTAARSAEVLGARWSEIDLATKIWTVPATRMKAGNEHRVPLSSRAVALIEQMQKVRSSEYVFPGKNRGAPVSGSALRRVLAGVEGASVHGFRSSFRDWCGEETATPREIAEAALAHVIGGVEAAYRRGDALEKRRVLMNAWAFYIEGGRTENIATLRA